MKQTLQINSNDSDKTDFALEGKIEIKIAPADRLPFTQKGIELDVNKLIIYKKVILRGIEYTSLRSKEISTIDYFVQLKCDDQFGAVEYFTVFYFELYALIKTYETIDEQVHFFQISCTGHEMLVKIIDCKKVIYMKFGLREFVTLAPNNFEKT